MEEEKAKTGGTGAQLLGSLAAAALIVALAIWAVTAKLGPTGLADQDAAEEAEEAREEEAEEAAGERGRNRRRGGRN